MNTFPGNFPKDRENDISKHTKDYTAMLAVGPSSQISQDFDRGDRNVTLLSFSFLTLFRTLTPMVAITSTTLQVEILDRFSLEFL